MCTAVNLTTSSHYFGRTLDLEYSYQEQAVITPKNYVFNFSDKSSDYHYAIIGIATVVNNYPLYYDAANEKGLCIAGLNFPNNAYYSEPEKDKINLAPFELIPYVLAGCQSVREAEKLLQNVNITNKNFSDDYKSTPLHWIISDDKESITVEPLREELKIYKNAVGALTNNPPFDWHLTNLVNYINLTPNEPKNRFCDSLDLTHYSRGMGAAGLPGDYSSASRFIKAAFVSNNSVSGNSESESVSQFFHILNSVAVPRGSVRLPNEREVITVYSNCYNASKGRLYYTSYENSQISCVDMNKEDLSGKDLLCYDLILNQQIKYQN
ncbi:MAG: choloylglycine hydrolase [Clostridia bacterium]|nr:choloylglycine hydrolase [Clostridia bacterium]